MAKNTLLIIPDNVRRVIFIAILLLSIILPIEPGTSGLGLYINAPIALFLGIIVALFMGNPFISINKKATTILLQVSVVCLGFHLDLQHALKAGTQGLFFTIATIVLTLTVGWLLGKWLKIDNKISFLISNGTAICGGSAIAAVAPIVKANDHEISVSLGTVFILNSIALIVFPTIGHSLNLSAEQFGTWCAIAIHDTSSVVGAATGYFDSKHLEALPIATAVKLERALWIIPISLITAYFQKNTGKIKIPYFIFYFIIAIVISTYFPINFKIADKTPYDIAYLMGKKGLVITLFLIGSGLSVNTIKQVGWRPILQGVLLWLLIGSISLVSIMKLIG